jgi:hypothetical protein
VLLAPELEGFAVLRITCPVPVHQKRPPRKSTSLVQSFAYFSSVLRLDVSKLIFPSFAARRSLTYFLSSSAARRSLTYLFQVFQLDVQKPILPSFAARRSLICRFSSFADRRSNTLFFSSFADRRSKLSFSQVLRVDVFSSFAGRRLPRLLTHFPVCSTYRKKKPTERAFCLKPTCPSTPSRPAYLRGTTLAMTPVA